MGTQLDGNHQLSCQVCGAESCWLLLRPYQHQVSGHHRVMLFDDETICKPLMQKEYTFYQTVPEKISKFVPRFKGVAKVCAKTDEKGHDHLFAMLINKNLTPKKECFCKESIITAKTNSSHQDQCKWKYASGKDESRIEKTYDKHPWVEKVQLMSFERNMHKTEGSKLILLELLGAKFTRPCMMDVKMGIRQYGDDATELKIKDHKERSDNSTSSSLGVRLCGMQVYDPASNTYTYTDKYTGRQLDIVGFKNCLYNFLNKGKRTDVIGEILESLANLYTSIESLDKCRLFCSSILIMYEGDVGAEGSRKSELRMIDFANVTLFSDKHEGPDDGYLFGLRNLCRLFTEIDKHY